MAETLIVIEPGQKTNSVWPALQALSPGDYLAGCESSDGGGKLIINLASDYRYLSTGYYCSLLAEARSQRIIPSVRTIEDLSRKTIYGLTTRNLSRLARQLSPEDESARQLTFYSYFGFSPRKGGGELCRQLFEHFPAPILKIELVLRKEWEVSRLTLVPLRRLPASEQDSFTEGFRRFLGKRWRRSSRTRNRYRYDLAVLHDPGESMPPSDRGALARLTRVGRKMKINVELVTRRDYPRIAEYDALFIRETTAINHHTFDFATRAQEEEIPVIDDPDSILRCTNKVYLNELLNRHRIAQPRTFILNRNNLDDALRQFELPIVLKVPDGSFSRGVFKADNAEEFSRIAHRLLADSELVLAQEFIYTPFDWRIGVLNGQPLFACRYFMARKHWQIYDHSGSGKKAREGGWETIAVEQAPANVVDTATKAARLIGDGLYGVDLKELPGRAVVIEVNDNPNIDARVEDAVLGDRLYEMLLEEFIRRIESPLRGQPDGYGKASPNNGNGSSKPLA
ncbi:MAG TPA: RimK family protein [Gammaproteobacteria bacterium]|nr:RimK family protein [Gammaproteobacteria bacterium]